MSADFIVRIIGMAVFAIVGVYVGNGLSVYNPEQQLFYTITFTLIGALLGLILTPYITTRPIRALRAVLGRLAAETLFSALIGLSIGLLTAALLAFPLSLLPAPLGKIMPLVGVVLFGYFGVAVFTTRQADIANILSGLTSRREEGLSGGGVPDKSDHPAGYQCHHRWARRRYRQDGIPARHFTDPALCTERTPIHRRLTG